MFVASDKEDGSLHIVVLILKNPTAKTSLSYFSKATIIFFVGDGVHPKNIIYPNDYDNVS